MKLQFKATDAIQSYHDAPDWADGDERNVSDEQSAYLLKTFPANFSKVGKEAVEPPEEKADEGPKENKAVEPPESNKGIFRRKK